MIGRPRSLRGLTIAFLGLFLTVTTAAGLGTFFATLSTINDLVDHRIEAESHALAPLGHKISLEELRRKIAAMASDRDTGDLGVLLTDRQGRRVAGNARFTRTLPVGFSSLDRQDRIRGLSVGRVLVRDIDGGLRLAVFAETEPIDHYFNARRRIYIGGFGAIILVVLLGLLLFRRLIGDRIEQTRLTAESIIEGDLSRRVPLAGDGGEFDRQAASFNHMLDRIEILMAEIRNVSNDISHELRTPLAKLRNELSLIEQREDAASIREPLRLAKEQADELLGMFRSMLRIAEIESGSRRAGFEALALHTLVREMADMVGPLAEESGHQVITARCDAISLIGDRHLMSQMVLNLLENAVRHTPSGTRITLSLTSTGNRAVLSISDEGPGIPESQRALVLRRFGRLDRSRQKQGHGLGLALVEAIVRLHHGTLDLQDAQPGLRVVVTLPQ
ncbi:MAG TPA: ATP-binding protein [Sphingobium sp.]